MKTTTLGLKKPEGTDLVNIQDINDNMDTIEKELQARPEKNGESSDMTVTFTQASSRANIATGEKMNTLMGKIKKWFSDMTVAAFAQVITSNADLMALTKSGYLVDALAVKNQFSEVNSKLQASLNLIQCGWVDLTSNGLTFIEADVILINPYIDTSYVVIISPIVDVNPGFNRADFYTKKIDNSHFRVCMYRENENVTSGETIRVGWISYHISQ